ncbi:RNAse (barnase) inhibitor barstar [Streptomyces sp. KhCrAH-43]|uniref:barstar family protein n=1 Tax=unclassified Streptomyces TaxID=2593676 RepID=UPI000368D07A|nr:MULTISPECIES: barstar family protein [unclassified Streptomyces]MYS39325.1 barnase inhibitor [Streptomyces sp. SID4920]MYX69640.1 barnase inhibitor [Streptomyces sp. SID8373]RAJ59575.1 RNAse (barnase) inhibitor barstar [Streptomyces sp. KhCrAH-43]
MTVTYVIEGSRITGPDSFWTVVGEAVNGPGGYFGRNLDAFADCLSGGMGTPDDGDFVFEWRDHALSARALGHAETARYLERTAARAHESNRGRLREECAQAAAGIGPTLFDRLVEIIRDRSGPDALRLL